MGKNRIFAVVLTAGLMLTCTTGWGTQYYVDPYGSDDANGLSWVTAFATIQKGVDVAVSGDVVEVSVGTYEETVDFDGNSIILTSTDPNNWDVVAVTIIDANNASLDVVTFDSSEDANTLLTGFTLTGGDGGVHCSSGSPTISKCIIRNNDTGIGVIGSGGPLITNNKMYDNTDDGIYYSYSSPVSIKIKNNMIYDNGDDGIFGYHGVATVSNNTIVGNSDDGIQHAGPGVLGIGNCIIWDNGDDLDNCSASYSCIKDGDAGTGNISSDPCFVDEPNDNFHLSLNSPCINAGDPNGTYTNELDIDNQIRKNDTTVDMGADELYRAHNIDTELWYLTIQAALDDANYGETIEVLQGTFYETIDFNGTSCTLTSTDPNDWDVVAATIIDANNGSLDVVTFDSSEDANTLLTGLTLTGGDEGVHCSSGSPTIKRCIIEGCAIGIKAHGGTPPIINNIIRDNSDDGINFNYGGPAPVKIKNNLVYSNSDDGITGYWGAGHIINNTVVGNSDKGIARGGPAGYVSISNCIIWGNSDDLSWSGGSVTYSCIEDGDGGTGNISSDPCFVETIYYHIDANSLCIDVGDTSPDYSGELDIDGGVRLQDGDGDGNSIVDMGADEYDVPPVAVLVVEPNCEFIGENITFDGSDSYDNGSIIKYEWDFDGDLIYDYSETSGSAGDGAFDGNTTHTYNDANTYTVTLQVTDNGSPSLTDTETYTVYAIALPFGTKALKVAGGEGHSLVIIEDSDSTYVCGANGSISPVYYGILGTGSDTTDLAHTNFVAVHNGDMVTDSGYLEDIKDISAGWQHSLAADTSGYVWAWGYNSCGELGNDSTAVRTEPIKVMAGEQNPADPTGTFLQGIDFVAAGRSGRHSLALDSYGYVWAWGLGSSGQLGDDSWSNSDMPVKVHDGEQGNEDQLRNIVGISAGTDHSIAVDSSEAVYTWGSAIYGKLGEGSTTGEKKTPVQVKSGEQDPENPNTYLQNIVAVSAGWYHSMALEKLDSGESNNGRVYTWGSNKPHPSDGGGNNSPCGGRLGDDSTDDAATPVFVLSGDQDPENSDSHLINIIAISAGEGHSMALDNQGCVWTWGDNFYGQLGIGTTDANSLVPKKVVGYLGEGYLENIVSISAGYWHCMAIDTDGRIWSWGKAKDGEIGLGTNNDKFSPYPVPLVYNDTNNSLYFSIQDALDVASSDDVIKAWPGTYFECIDIDDSIANSITLQSYDPYDFDTVKDTIIDGTGGTAIYIMDNSGFVLNGFTVAAYQRCSYGLDIFDSSLITNCIIRDCSTGAIVNGDTIIKNCWIYDNGLGEDEGGICVNSGTLTIRNCTIVDNDNYGIDNDGGTANISNCILWGNDSGGTQLDGCPDFYYSHVQGVDSADPCFVDESNDDFHIKYDSPCKNAGDPNPNPSYDGEFDIDGEAREREGRVDIGADETGPPICWECATQCHGDADCSGFVDTVDWPPFRDGFFSSYPNQDYLDNICGDYDHDGDIDTGDWPEFRDNFGTSPPADCPTDYDWPPT